MSQSSGHRLAPLLPAEARPPGADPEVLCALLGKVYGWMLKVAPYGLRKTNTSNARKLFTAHWSDFEPVRQEFIVCRLFSAYCLLQAQGADKFDWTSVQYSMLRDSVDKIPSPTHNEAPTRAAQVRFVIVYRYVTSLADLYRTPIDDKEGATYDGPLETARATARELKALDFPDLDHEQAERHNATLEAARDRVREIKAERARHLEQLAAVRRGYWSDLEGARILLGRVTTIVQGPLALARWHVARQHFEALSVVQQVAAVECARDIVVEVCTRHARDGTLSCPSLLLDRLFRALRDPELEATCGRWQACLDSIIGVERIYSAHEAHEAALPLLGELHARLKQVEIVERFAALPVPEQQRAIARCREVHGWVASTASARVGLPEDAAVADIFHRAICQPNRPLELQPQPQNLSSSASLAHWQTRGERPIGLATTNAQSANPFLPASRSGCW